MPGKCPVSNHRLPPGMAHLNRRAKSMKLADIYSAAIKQSDDLVSLSKTPAGSAYDKVLLRSALVFAMAAIDRLLHEAISRKFAVLARSKALDRLVSVDLSASYRIAQGARTRKGKGGKIKSRPGNRLKEEFLKDIFTATYLSLKSLQELTAACGKGKIFTTYGDSFPKKKKATKLQSAWSRIYARRNHIAHECDIARMARARTIKFNDFSARSIRKDIRFVRAFGAFLSTHLE